MFVLFFERRHNVLLVRFSGRVTPEDFARLDVAARALVASQGPAHGLVDFTDVETFDVDTQAFVQRGQRAAIMTGKQRIFVMPRPDFFGLGRMFATHQKIGGNLEPVVVRTMGEAYKALELVDPEFEPMPLPETS